MTSPSPTLVLLHLGTGTAPLPEGLQRLAQQWPLQTLSAEQADEYLHTPNAPVVLLGDTQHARHVIDLTQRYAAQIHALVLLSPPAFEDATVQNDSSALASGEVATLLLHGTELSDSEEAQRAHAYKQAWPQAQLVYLYAAGSALAKQRPATFAEVISDFIRYQEGFVINRASTLLNP